MAGDAVGAASGGHRAALSSRRLGALRFDDGQEKDGYATGAINANSGNVIFLGLQTVSARAGIVLFYRRPRPCPRYRDRPEWRCPGPDL